jgi:eukaryotic-like serine/threonine-protein kinase
VEGSLRVRPVCISENTLAAFAEGVFSPAERLPIEEHLTNCPDCRAVVVRAAGASGGRSDGGTLPAAIGPEILASGTRVGRYVVADLIGSGAMGTVYAAHDPDLDRKVAVKLLHAGALSEAARQRVRARLLREAKAMARLSHPEVMTVYDVGAFGEQLFVAMEYVDGGTLRRWRAERHRTYADVMDVYERAGSGLAAAHEAGLVHRDFKPDNVLVGRDGRVRVMDFGLARSVGRDDVAPGSSSDGEFAPELGCLSTTLTRTGTLLGTPAYMAPEQLRGEPANAQSDVFGFSVALYEALYGERPFGGSNMVELRAAIERGDVRPPPIMTRVPGWVREVLLHGLRPLPEDRFASMRGLIDALRAAHVRAKRRARRAVAATVVGLVVTVSGGVYVCAGQNARRASVALASAAAPKQPTEPAHVDSVDLSPSRATAELLLARQAASAAVVPPSSPPGAPKGERLAVRLAKPVTPTGRAPGSGQVPPRSTAGASSEAGGVPLVGNNGALILE